MLYTKHLEVTFKSYQEGVDAMLFQKAYEKVKEYEKMPTVSWFIATLCITIEEATKALWIDVTDVMINQQIKMFQETIKVLEKMKTK